MAGNNKPLLEIKSTFAICYNGTVNSAIVWMHWQEK